MSDLIRPLGEYLSLLEQEGLLADPVPDSLDRSAPVALVSCDSRNVVPGTLFLCKGSHFREEFLEAARERGRSSTPARHLSQLARSPGPAAVTESATGHGPWLAEPVPTAIHPGG